MKRAAKTILKRSVYYAFSLILLLPACREKEIKTTVWVASPWQRVMRDTPPGTVRSASLKAAANEYEPFRIIIHNDGMSPISNVNVTISDIKGPEGMIKANEVQLYRSNYINITLPSLGTNNPVGWYPDALIPFLPANSEKRTYSQSYLKWLSNPEDTMEKKILYISAPFIVDPGQNAEVWCDLYVPHGTKPGNYSGVATVVSGKQKLADIPVSLTVWGFELPAAIAMRSNFGTFTQAAGNMMGINYGTQDFFDIEKLFNEELLKNRAIPGTPSYAWPILDEMNGLVHAGETARMKELVEKEHFNSLDIPFRYRDNADKCSDYLADVAGWLDSLGYTRMAYVDLGVEPHSAADYKNIRSQAAMIKSASPQIMRFCTVETLPQDKSWGNLYGSVDIWAPLWGMWDEKTAAERLAKGEQLWSYTALCQGPAGTPWWQIDMDPLNFRAPLWISWHFNITGLHYWSSVFWSDYSSLKGVWESPFYHNHYWGEGLLLYPGNVAATDHFVPSIRLKLYREAEEDYEYMTLAAKLGMKEEADKIVDGVATSFQDWSHDDTAYEQAREKLANLILRKK